MHYSSTLEKKSLNLKYFLKMNLTWSEFVIVSRMFGLDINRGMKEKHIYYGNWKLQESYPEWLEIDSDDTLTAKVKLEWLIRPWKFNSNSVCLLTAFFYLRCWTNASQGQWETHV